MTRTLPHPIQDIDYLEKVYFDIQNASNGPVSLPAFRRYYMSARSRVNLKRISMNQVGPLAAI